MLAENLVEPYKQGQNTPSKPLLAIESKSDEERAEQIPPEINSCEQPITQHSIVVYSKQVSWILTILLTR